MMMEAIHEVDIGDLSAEARQIADVIGLDGLMALAAVMGGGWVYIPHPKCLTMAARNRRIRAEFNGRNLRELATRHGLSVRRIRSIVAEGQAIRIGRGKKVGVATQLKLF